MSDRLDLDGALMALAPELRTAVVLPGVVGHDYATIAAILDIPIGTVRSRLSRGPEDDHKILRSDVPSTAGRPLSQSGTLGGPRSVLPPDSREPR